MAHAVDLLMHGLLDGRMTIAMDRAPPGGHAVDELAAIGQLQLHALGGYHGPDRCRCGHGGIGMPKMLAVEAQSLVPVFDHGDSLGQDARCKTLRSSSAAILAGSGSAI